MTSLDIRIVVPLSSLPATLQIGKDALAAAGPVSGADAQPPPTDGGPTQDSGDKTSTAEMSSSTGPDASTPLLVGKVQTSSPIQPGTYIITNGSTGNLLCLKDENDETEVTTDSGFQEDTIPDNAKGVAPHKATLSKEKASRKIINICPSDRTDLYWYSPSSVTTTPVELTDSDAKKTSWWMFREALS
ncbi:hypothetical protein OF83DRAFT_1081028 [Amylostereum chailletii]|nr:hypothetical protein OF83DRAFT_1081028 [Amylostereum chailletii]